MRDRDGSGILLREAAKDIADSPQFAEILKLFEKSADRRIADPDF